MSFPKVFACCASDGVQSRIVSPLKKAFGQEVSGSLNEPRTCDAWTEDDDDPSFYCDEGDKVPRCLDLLAKKSTTTSGWNQRDRHPRSTASWTCLEFPPPSGRPQVTTLPSCFTAAKAPPSGCAKTRGQPITRTVRMSPSASFVADEVSE